MHEALQKIGFHPSKLDVCLCNPGNEDDNAMQTLYVDDVLLGGPSRAATTQLRDELTKSPDVTGLRAVQHFFDNHNRTGLTAHC